MPNQNPETKLREVNNKLIEKIEHFITGVVGSDCCMANYDCCHYDALTLAYAIEERLNKETIKKVLICEIGCESFYPFCF